MNTKGLGIIFRKAKETIIITTFFQLSGNSTYLVLKKKKKIIAPKKLLRSVFVESQLVSAWPFCKCFLPVQPKITLFIIIKKRGELGWEGEVTMVICRFKSKSNLKNTN